MERRSIYKSIRNEDPRYADSIVGSPDYMVSQSPHTRLDYFLHSTPHLGAGSSARQAIHILRRFLVSRLHSIRVPSRLPSLQRQHT